MGEPLGADLAGIYTIVAALLGVLVGSFLNVCIYRIPRDLSVIYTRSFCPRCGYRIAWFDNIPVLSYVWLRGRCRHCGMRIGIRYPAVELATGGLFAALFIRYGWSLAALKWGMFESFAVVLFCTDLEERILPDELTLGGSVIGLLFVLFVPVHGELVDLLAPGIPEVLRSLGDALLGMGFFCGMFWLLALLFRRIRRKEVLGLGDVKLLLLLGAFLGFERELSALLIGAVAGATLGIVYILTAGKNAASYQLPLGSFLCLGAAILPLSEGSSFHNGFH